MLSFQQPAFYQSSKCFVTHGVMGHVDPKQPPSKGKPWTAFASQDFVYTADLILPQEVLEAVQGKLLRDEAVPEYKGVVMSLHDILTGDFFNSYIKQGNILMLSEGRRGIDNVFALKSGHLAMFLDKEAYERAGLVGKPHGVKGRRGLKPRWIVEIDLNSSSMVKGKKGYDRLIYASKNAFSEPMTWLFYNAASTVPDPDPLTAFSPTSRTATPSITPGINALVPNLTPPTATTEHAARDELEDFSSEVYEWLSLVRLQSLRILEGDNIDPYLSQYQVPDGSEPAKVCKISWRGFFSPSWTRQTMIDLITALPSKTWFSFSTTTFSKGLAGDNTECTFLRPPNSAGEYLMWEVKSHE
ncbi:ribonuclease P 40kDa subunit-domain-containing protein [Triangularia verruculosa]|uniref:Ribonuclease P 40kDa subunit-domain-containing protein n=1 Tax=Triangularia verruculosa TaxID=2587418 RepID=A0AAN6XIS2_9PEZI|nr:ribonuclease P 40kDa subunit-domain-containing protein [Triangularia verruculosa]